MPRYDFVCHQCGQVEEIWLSLARHASHAKRQRCSHCNGRMQQRITAVALKTDTRLMAGSDDGFGADDTTRRKARQKASNAGVNISGKRFCAGLCRTGHPLDPYAWYGDKAELVRKTQALGRGASGRVEVKPRPVDVPNPLDLPYRTAPSNVAKELDTVIQQQYGGRVSSEKRAELQEELIVKHSGTA